MYTYNKLHLMYTMRAQRHQQNIIEENDITRADVTNFPICSLLIYYANFYIRVHTKHLR